MNNKIYILLPFLMLGMGFGTYAQKNKSTSKESKGNPAPEAQTADFAIVCKPKNGAIWLRWTPFSQSAWDKSTEFGYDLNRINTKTNEKKVIFKDKLPNPINFWKEKLLAKDDKYAMMGYCLFGYLEDPDRKITGLIEAIEEANNRYLMAIVAVDNSFEVAMGAAMGFIDSTAVLGESYQYTLSIRNKREVGQALPVTSKTVSLDLKNEIIAPLLTAKSGTKTAVLEWDTQALRSLYNSYIVETSLGNDQNFERINKGAVLNPPISESPAKIFIDSLPDYKTMHYYRVKGIDVFQDEGAYSNIVKVKARPVIPQPEIQSFELKDSTTLVIDWAFGDSLQAYIQGFRVQQSDSLYSDYKDTSPLLLAGSRHRIIQPLHLPINVRVSVVVDSTTFINSFPIVVMASDSIPPAVPTGIYAEVDSLGVVNIVWNKNTEKDLRGYFVARGDLTSNEFARVSKDLIAGEFFQDTLDMKLMNRDYFYTVMAADKRMNVSEMSTAFHIKKKDIYPPTRPVFIGYQMIDKQVSMNWVRSFSNDVVSYSLYRKDLPDDKWHILKIFNDTLTNSYRDSTVAQKSLYAYTIIAKDESNNESEPANPLLIETPFFTKNVNFEAFEAVLDENAEKVTLSWQCKDLKEIESFQLYKAIDKDEFSMMKKLETNVFVWKDSVNDASQSQRYLIRAKMKDGYLSGWKEATVNIKR